MFVLPEVALQRMIQIGFRNLRSNRDAFDKIFQQYTCDELNTSYGQQHIDKMWNWFTTTKIPVMQAWSFDLQKVPGITIHLADESEDESKAAVNDFFGMEYDEFEQPETEIKVNVNSVSLDIGIHADRSKDHVLWMYYIVNYIFFKEKLVGERLGLQLFTFRASDYNKESKYMADNVWSRWVRFRCTVQNFIDDTQATEKDLGIDICVESSGEDSVGDSEGSSKVKISKSDSSIP
jgi:hypothetical protein